jgi:gas vesicle protein
MGVFGKTLRFIGGLAVGAGIGAVAAMLVAPQSGEQSKQQLQDRINEILRAGQRASRAREDELYAAWEAELNEGQPGKAKRPKIPAGGDDEAAREREKARAAAQRTQDEARAKAQKELEQAQQEARKHLDQAQAELAKAEKAEKS